MVNFNSDALGIIFPNSYDSTIPELTQKRSMASIPFGSRYRLIDFMLSSMVNGGIDNVTVMVRENYLSLLDHLGSGREWDLARKNGGLNTIPPFAYKSSTIYNGRIEGLNNISNFLMRQKEKYVVISDANIAANIDFKKILDTHIKSGADATVVYNYQDAPSMMPESIKADREMFYVLELENSRIKKIRINPDIKGGKHPVSMNIYVMEREKLLELVKEAYRNGNLYFERDILAANLDNLNIMGYEYDDYVARIFSMKSYFDESMKLLDEENLDTLFGKQAIHTKVRDDNPTRYVSGSVAKNIMAADGCIIEGTVENSILFRGVKIAKGAVVKNCILMQDTIVEAGATMDYVVTDKNVCVGQGQAISGTDSFPVYIAKGRTV